MPKLRRTVITALPAAPRSQFATTRGSTLSPQTAAQLLMGLAAANAQQPQPVRPALVQQPQPPQPRGLLGRTGGLLGSLGYGRP
jgi:hypothetical protein